MIRKLDGLMNRFDMKDMHYADVHGGSMYKEYVR